MKRESLLRHMRRHGCILRREGKEHHENPETGHAEAIPRHSEIAKLLVDRPGHSNSTDRSVTVAARLQLEWSIGLSEPRA